ncbi:MAG: fused MFS/spermidine synthase, partial [Deltaproteobacteria bacterium]|nr:fused MFS/spermidine synthase [Deltaproteobacteria bacterium]
MSNTVKNKPGLLKPILRKLWPSGDRNGPTIVFEGDSAYNHITVMDNNGIRTMFLGQNADEAETSINIANPESAVFEYPGMMLAALALAKNREILMLGLGGGFIPNIFKKHLPNHNLTVVELDPLVAEIAETYFWFKAEKNIKLVIKEGLEFISGAPNNAYDQIWLDAYGGEHIPEHLTTLDFLAIVQLKLAPDGLLVQNLHQTAGEVYYRQLYQTQELFGAPPLLFGGIHCANTIAMSLNSETKTLPTADRELISAFEEFGETIGPYDLLDQVPKMLKLTLKPPRPF